MSLSNPTYQELANYAHAGAGASVVLVAGHFGYPLLAAGMVALYGVVKEFWYDLKYERPEVSGGVRGGFTDIAGYLTGVILAIAVLKL